MVKFLLFLALAACVHTPSASAKSEEARPTEKPKPRNSKYWHQLDWSLVKIDPATADTVDDAVYNCVHDFAQYEPRWACNPTNQIIGPYATMCTPDGNPLRLRTQLYQYCANRDAGRDGRKPYLKKMVSGKGTTIIKTGTQVPAKAGATVGAPIIVVGGESGDGGGSSEATKTTTKTASSTDKTGSSAGSQTAMTAGATIEPPPQRPVKLENIPESSASAMRNSNKDGTSRTATRTSVLETEESTIAAAATPTQSGNPSKVTSIVGASAPMIYNINVEGATQMSNITAALTTRKVAINEMPSRTGAAAGSSMLVGVAAGDATQPQSGKPAVVANVVGPSTSMIHNINVEIDGDVDGDVKIEIGVDIDGQDVTTTLSQTAKHTVMVLAVSKTTVTDISTVTGTKTITGIGFVTNAPEAMGTRTVSKTLDGETQFRTVIIRPVTVDEVGYDDRHHYGEEPFDGSVDDYVDQSYDTYDCWEECEEGEQECFETCWDEHKR